MCFRRGGRIPSASIMSDGSIRVTVWGEFRHERSHEAVAKIYPQGMHGTIAAALSEQLGDTVSTRTATPSLSASIT